MSRRFRVRTGPSTFTLSEQQGYLALELFLAQIVARGDLMAGEVGRWVTTDEDGRSADPAMWDDWLECVRVAVGVPLAHSADTFEALGSPEIEPIAERFGRSDDEQREIFG